MASFPDASVRHWFRRRRYNLFKFQTRYAAIFIVFSALITALVSSLTYSLFSGAAAGDGLGGSKWEVAGIVLVVLISFAIFYMLVILASHRLAGPLLLMSTYMQEVQNGRHPAFRDLRQGDELKEFYAGFRNMLELMSKRDNEELATLRKIFDTLSSYSDEALKNELSRLIADKSLRAERRDVN